MLNYTINQKIPCAWCNTHTAQKVSWNRNTTLIQCVLHSTTYYIEGTRMSRKKLDKKGLPGGGGSKRPLIVKMSRAVIKPPMSMITWITTGPLSSVRNLVRLFESKFVVRTHQLYSMLVPALCCWWLIWQIQNDAKILKND